jgi:diguanylate cyclase (GGDEF)-like protein
MELRSLLRVVARRWWLVLPVFLVAFGSSIVFTLAQRPVYESNSKLLVAPAGQFDDVLSAVATLSRQPEIAETYAQIANSRTIRQEASASLGLTAGDQRAVQMESRLVPGTNILELTARSVDPELARQYNDAVSAALVAYTASVSPAFELQILDTANATTDPVSPNVGVNAALGFAAAAILAMGLGIGAELIQPRRSNRARFDMLDRDSIAYSEPFFMLRLRQEMYRATRSQSKLVVALINMNHGDVLRGAPTSARNDILRHLAGLLDSHLRLEDISARLGPDLFALLLPDTTEAEAVVMIDALRRRMNAPAVGFEEQGGPLHVKPAAGLVEFSGQSTTAAGLLEQARSALRDAETIPVGKTQAFSALRPA